MSEKQTSDQKSSSQSRPYRNKRRPSKGKSKKSPKVYRNFAPLVDDDYKRLATSIDDGTYIVFDIESTGGNPEKNGITEISALRYRNGVVEDKFYSLVNPQCRIPPIVRKMTGIDQAMVKDAPLIKDVMPGFIEFIRKDILVSHNTIGDLKFLVYFAKQACNFDLENFFLCTHLLTEKLISEAPDKSLKGLAVFFDYPIGAIHRADADAELTLCLFKEICTRLKANSRNTIEDGIRLQGDIESGIRLGWAVDESQIKNPPKGPGVFYLYGKEAKTLFLSSVPNLERDFQKLTQYRQLPRRLLRIVLNSYEIKFESHPNLFAAMLGEGKALSTNSVAYDPSEWHLRSPQTLFFKEESEGIRVGIGQVEPGIKYAFGLVSDRKACLKLIENISEIMGVKSTRQGAVFPLEKEKALLSFFSGSIAADWASARKSRFSLKNIFNKVNRQMAGQVCSDMKSLASLVLPRGMRNLLGESGIVVGPAVKKGGWLLYPVIDSRPEKPVEVSGDWREWLEESADGKKLVSHLKHPDKKDLVKSISRQESARISATLWLMYVNKGRGGRCHFIPSSEL